MITTIVIFFISTLLAFSILYLQIWKLQTGKVEHVSEQEARPILADYKRIEKITLYVVKNITFVFILITVKYWYLMTTKLKKWFEEKKPAIVSILKIKQKEPKEFKPTFIRRAIFELKIRIKRIKQAIKKEHE